MNTEKVYILEDRGILYINGPDSKKFLQNLISNDIEKVNESRSCFASLLSPQGKFLFDFIVIKHKDGYLLDCEKKIVDQLYKKLVTYKLRSDVEILNLDREIPLQKVIFVEWPENLRTDRNVDIIINLDHDNQARHASIKCKKSNIESSIKTYYENN